jgi:hypothetical protein
MFSMNRHGRISSLFSNDRHFPKSFAYGESGETKCTREDTSPCKELDVRPKNEG